MQGCGDPLYSQCTAPVISSGCPRDTRRHQRLVTHGSSQCCTVVAKITASPVTSLASGSAQPTCNSVLCVGSSAGWSWVPSLPPASWDLHVEPSVR